jgi:hypothetical protein
LSPARDTAIFVAGTRTALGLRLTDQRTAREKMRRFWITLKRDPE